MDMEDTSKLKILRVPRIWLWQRKFLTTLESRSVKQSAAASIMEKYRS